MSELHTGRRLVELCDEFLLILTGGHAPDRARREALAALIDRAGGELDDEGTRFALKAAAAWMAAADDAASADPEFARSLALDQVRLVLRQLTELRFD